MGLRIRLSRALVISAALLLSACSCSGRRAAPCVSDVTCSSAGLVCDFARGLCSECARDTDCAGGGVCIEGMCTAPVPCATSSDCPGLVCDPRLRRCVECVSGDDCPISGECSESRCLAPPPDAGPQDADLPIPTIDGGVVCAPETREVDLLFVIDDSNSMSEEQESLAVALPALVRAIASGDVDADGDVDFAGVESIHLGVVSTDMGTGGFMTATCGNAAGSFASGNDGVLQTEGSDDPSCAESFPSVLSFARSRDDADAFGHDGGCLIRLGTGGCGFEQHFEATLKALSPDRETAYTAPGWIEPHFLLGEGHAEGANAGFLRDDSVLVVVIVSDEEDCSSTDPSLFDIHSARYGTVDFNLRCFTFPEVLYPIDRYVYGLTGVRRIPQRLVLGLLVGVPKDLEPADEVVDWEGILAAPALQEEIDAEEPTRLRRSCVVAERGGAFPPRRLLRLGQRIEERGATATLASICQADYVPFARRLAAAIGRVLPETCSDE